VVWVIIQQGGLSFALQRQLSAPPGAPLTLSMADMRRALREARPHFGSGGGGGDGDSGGQSSWLHPRPGLAVCEFRPEVPALLEDVMACLRQARGMGAAGGASALPPLLTILLQGPPGGGKVTKKEVLCVLNRLHLR